MKKFLALLLALLCVVSLVACKEPVADDVEDDTKDTSGTVTDGDTDTDEIPVTPANMGSGIKLTDTLSYLPRSDNDKIGDSTEFIRVSDIDEKYVMEVVDDIVYIDYRAPMFEIGGIANPSENGGSANRLDSSRLSDFESQLVNEDTMLHATFPSGATLRFSTVANEVVIKAKLKDSISDNNLVFRGTYGMDVYIGSGTDRESSSKVLSVSHVEQTCTGTITLPGGYCEVLINLPMGGAIESFSIGFKKSARVGLPLERDHAPIVFYGSEITQGLGSTRPGVGYANLVCRMLNVDCINQGYYGGVHGEQIMADYLASMDMSAFVMEFDSGATLDELRANHYNVYKTVRNAHPDIPIVIMSDPIFSPEELEASAPRIEVIKETLTRALEEGDNNVYFIDGGKLFPMGDEMSDIYSRDMKTANDLGMYYIGLAVYDVINSAFTPDEMKSGVDREAGLYDAIDFTPKASTEDVASGDFVKVSSVASRYVRKKDGITYLSYLTPQISVGGINDPNDNGGAFYRLDHALKQYYIENCVDSRVGSLWAYMTAGGNLRFRTNADEIVIDARINNIVGTTAHVSVRGNNGIDVYVGTGSDKVYVGEVGQSFASRGRIQETVKLPGGYVEVMIELPLFAGINSIEIGFKSGDAMIASPLEREHAPVVFYGSSITHGCSAVKPMNAYTNLVCRMLDVDCASQGYTGAAHGEQFIAEYIANMEMSAFVLDYDHNANSAQELSDTHYKFYKTVRDANPDIPIIIISRPIFTKEPTSYEKTCRQIIESTYNMAVAAGDTNVYFIDGHRFFPMRELMDIYMVDGVHPNDLGFYYMAKAVYELLSQALK